VSIEYKSSTATWFRGLRPDVDPVLRLICFPHAGGSAGFFHPWRRWTPPGVELVAVQYPGRQDRINEPCAEDLHDLADRVTGALADLSARPVVLFGHSMGAAIAHEVALRLERTGGPELCRLVVSGRRSPFAAAHPGPDVDDDEALAAEVRGLGGAGSEALVDPDLRTLLLPAIRGDFRMCDTYRARPEDRITGALSAFVGDRDPKVTPDDIRGWTRVTRAVDQARVRVFPGDHFYLDAQARDVVGDIMRSAGIAA
jgi:pyochelin biosynthetic protein PchC